MNSLSSRETGIVRERRRPDAGSLQGEANCLMAWVGLMRMTEVVVVDGKTRELRGRNGKDERTAWERLNVFRASGSA